MNIGMQQLQPASFNHPKAARRRILALWRRAPTPPQAWRGLMGLTIPLCEMIDNVWTPTQLALTLVSHYPASRSSLSKLKSATRITPSMRQISNDDDLCILTLAGGGAKADLLVRTSSESFAYAASFWLKAQEISLTLETKKEENTTHIVPLKESKKFLQQLKAIVDAHSARDERLAEDKYAVIRSYDKVSDVVSALEQPSGGFLVGFDEGGKWMREMNQRHARALRR
jgi:hypothetical protein